MRQEGLEQILDVRALQDLLEHLHPFTGIACGVRDLEGRQLASAGFQDICARFHRVHPETRAHCIESARFLFGDLKEGEPALRPCRNNMWDLMIPIVVEGRHVATILLGQFFFEDEVPRREVFERQAERYGFDRREYLAALERVPRLSRARLQQAAGLYVRLAEVVARLSYGKLTIRRRAAEYARNLLEASLDPLITIDAQGRITDANQATAQVTGISRGELVGTAVSELFTHPEEARRACQQAFAEGHAIDSPLVIRSRGGRLTDVLFSAYVYKDGSGRVSGVFASARDVTERRRAEQRTSRKTVLLSGINRIFQQALTCATEEDLGRVCLAVAEEVTRSKLGFIGQVRREDGRMEIAAFSDPGWDACRMDAHGRDGEAPLALEIHGLYGRVIRDGEAFFTNDPRAHPDARGLPPGHPPIEAFLGVPLTHAGEVDGMVGLANAEGGYGPDDLEAAEALALAIGQAFRSKRAEEALRASEERLRLAQLVAHVGTFEWNVETGVRRWTPELEAMHGLPPGGFAGTGEAWERLVHPDDRRELARWVERTIAQGGGASGGGEGEWRAVWPDGTVRWLAGRAHVLRDPEGRPLQVIGVNIDITDRKRAEQDVLRLNRDLESRAALLEKASEEAERARRAAEEAARVKGEFLANMSHEIRTPMNGVVGMAELLLDTPLTREQLGYVQAIETSAHALTTLIDDILDFSKIEAGKLALELVPFDLRDEVADILQTLALRATQKGLELACQVAPEVPERVMGDPARLRQLLINLVGNAIKFTERGEIVVSAAVEAAAQGATVLRFSVRDTGIGIPPERQLGIFDPFVQADASTTRTHGGTGLGLTISARLSELMGGRIWVESEPGAGSTFHFTVRLGVVPGPPSRPAPGVPASLDGLRVLVVDDNETHRHVLEEALRRWRMEPTTAEDGPAALAALAKAGREGAPYGLLLLDALMPVMNGFELAERVRADPAFREVPIAMLTSSGHRGDADRCRALGISACIAKPIKQSALLDAILTLLDGAGREEASAPAPERQAVRRGSRPLRVLLAEDNVINQRIAAGVLEKRGHAVTIVGDGRAAVAAMEGEGSSRFDLVLMDVQMPVMDGLEATALIRQHERGTGRRIPIVALTAHAMKGDQEVCLAAGMDGYVRKPLTRDDLLEAIERVMAGSSGAGVPPQRIVKGPVIDPVLTLGSVDGDTEVLREVVGLSREDHARALEAIAAAIVAGDACGLERAAHSLRGSVGNFGAPSAVELARELEEKGRSGDLAGAEPVLGALREQIALVREALDDLVAAAGTGLHR